MKKRIDQIGVDVARSTFLWNLIDVCNYKCTYCNAPHGENYNDFKKFDNNKKNVWKNVLTRLSTRRVGKFCLDILGGEPTMHPGLEAICKEMDVNVNCEKVDVYTNLSKNLNYFSNYKNMPKIRFIAAYHPQYYNHKFIDKVLKLNTMRSMMVIPSINMSTKPEHWDQIEELIQYCSDNDVKFRINFLHSVDKGTEGDIPGVKTKKNVGIEWTTGYSSNFWNRFEGLINKNWRSLTNTNHIKPIKSIKEYIDQDSVRTRNTYIPGDKLPVEYSDGSSDHIYEGDLVADNLNMFKGYKCKTRLYYIDLDGQIVNYCTGEPVSVYMDEEELSKCRVCPHDFCDRRAFIYEDKTKYYRERTR